jgi:hypothetical protein
MAASRDGMTFWPTALIGCSLMLMCVPTAHAQGSATGVAVSPRTIVAGGTVSVSVTGTNPCGAVRINYGDGDAITYALTGLPVTQTHVYQKAGSYTITAEGMGNCGGAPTTTVEVSPPPAPPPAPPATATIKAVEIAPAPARVQEPVAVVARGSGKCAYEVRYGDGTAEQVDAPLPEDTHHTYAKAGRYVVIVNPKPPCVGKFTQVLQVEDAAAQPARITHIVASPSPGTAGQAIAIAVHGSGTCPYDIYYGDGTAEEVNGPLPQSTRHVYRQPGRYAVVVKPQPPCTGKFTEVVQVTEATTPAPTGPRISRVTAEPTPAAPRQPVRLTIDGFGACAFTIDYGDGNSDSRSMTLPGLLRHVYSAPGFYTVVVTPDDSQCKGSGRVSFEVRRYFP